MMNSRAILRVRLQPQQVAKIKIFQPVFNHTCLLRKCLLVPVNFHFQNLSSAPPPKIDLDEFEKTVVRPQGIRPGRAFLNDFVVHLIEHPEKLPYVPWPDLIRKVKAGDLSVTDLSFGAALLHVCNKYDHPAVAEEYMRVMKNPTLAMLSLYLILIQRVFQNSETFDETKIFDIYEQIKVKNRGVWDMDTGERVIRALAITSKWRECLPLFEEIKVIGKPSGVALSDVVSAAFRAHEFDLGWSLMTSPGFCRPAQFAIRSWLQHAPRVEASLTRLFEFMDDTEFYLQEDSIPALEEFFKDPALGPCKVLDTNLSQSGVCRMCSAQLDRNELTLTEFRDLTEAFFNKVLVDDDVFLNTSPDEVEDYKSFIKRHGPYDVILDGLNVAYSKGRDMKGIYNTAKQLERVIKAIYDKGDKTLVIGRDHMRKWPPAQMKNIRKMADVYLIADMSKDDPFIIYATMKSGQGARFVSKDFLRNHLYRLRDVRLARLFRRWRLSHQLNLVTNGDYFRLTPFSPLAPVAQKDPKTGIWHIPYDSEDNLTSPNAVPEKWLCVVPKRK